MLPNSLAVLLKRSLIPFLVLFCTNGCTLNEPSSIDEAIARIEIKAVDKQHFLYDIGDRKYFGYAFPDDFATKNKYEQKLIFRLLTEDKMLDVINSQLKNKIKERRLIYRLPLSVLLMHLIVEKQSTFAANLIFKDIINDDLDGASAEDYESDFVWPTLENFKKANDLIEENWVKRQADIFCYKVDIHHLLRDPRVIYGNIKDNGVYKFTEVVKGIGGCLAKIKNYEM